MFGVGFPPVGLILASMLSVVPLVVAGVTTQRPVRTALGVWIGAMPAWLFYQWWMRDVTALGMPLLVVHLAMYPAIFVLLMAWLEGATKRAPIWIGAGVCWAGLEFLRGHILWTGYPWYLIAQPSIATPAGRLGGSLIGMFGMGLIFAVLAGAVARVMLLERRRRNPSLLRRLGPLLALSALLGVLSLPWRAWLEPTGLPARASERSVRVALIQTNVPQSNREAWTGDQRVQALDEFEALTLQAASMDPKPDVIVWPETMFPGPLGLSRSVRENQPDPSELSRSADWRAQVMLLNRFAIDRVVAMQREAGVPLIVGSSALPDFAWQWNADRSAIEYATEVRFNSVFVIDDGVVRDERYDKQHLAPFGEVMPYISAWSWLEQQLLALGAQGMTFDLSAGGAPTVLGAGGVRLATPICFEAVMPKVCRGLVWNGDGRRADVLINMTNDGWFGEDWGGRWAHAMCARWRAVELGVPVLRAANTGISGGFDAFGRTLVTGPSDAGAIESTNVAGVVVVDVDLIEDGAFGRPLAARVGESPGWLAFGGTLVLALMGLRRRSKEQRGVHELHPAI